MKVFYISFIVVIIDQITKVLVKGFKVPFLNYEYQGMFLGQRIPVFGDFFRLTFVENPGMAFGYYPGIDFKPYLSIFSLLASIGLLVYIYIIRNQSLSLRVSLAFILGGAIGNLIDRMFYGVFYDYAPLFYGKVVDFLDFDFFNIAILGRSYDRFPIFNIADMAVTTGVMILILFYRSHQKEIENSESLAATEPESDPLPESSLTESAPENENQIQENKKENDGESDNGKETSV